MGVSFKAVRNGKWWEPLVSSWFGGSQIIMKVLYSKLLSFFDVPGWNIFTKACFLNWLIIMGYHYQHQEAIYSMGQVQRRTKSHLDGCWPEGFQPQLHLLGIRSGKVPLMVAQNIYALWAWKYSCINMYTCIIMNIYIYTHTHTDIHTFQVWIWCDFSDSSPRSF